MKRVVYLIVILALVMTALPVSAEASTYAQAQKYITVWCIPGTEQELFSLLDRSIEYCRDIELAYSPIDIAKALVEFHVRLVDNDYGDLPRYSENDLVIAASSIALWAQAIGEDAESISDSLVTLIQRTKLTIGSVLMAVMYTTSETDDFMTPLIDNLISGYDKLSVCNFNLKEIINLYLLFDYAGGHFSDLLEYRRIAFAQMKADGIDPYTAFKGIIEAAMIVPLWAEAAGVLARPAGLGFESELVQRVGIALNYDKYKVDMGNPSKINEWSKELSLYLP